MKKFIAERKLLYSEKGSTIRNELSIRLGLPFLLKEGMVNFQFDEGAAGCGVEFLGIDEPSYVAYGGDLIQAIHLASNIEWHIKQLYKKYDIYCLSGESYFDE